jgi:hypothetical protein
MNICAIGRSVLVASIGLLICVQSAHSQPDAEVTVTPPGRSIAFGSTTIDGEQWQRLSFRPEIPFGKIGVALDVELFLNSEGKISDRGWEFGNGTEIANTIFRKIYYVRYGQRGEPVYGKIGALDNVTLGYGFIMSGYRNTLDYPGTKNLGLEFELQPGSGIRVEGMLNNFSDVGNGGPLMGLRVAKELLPGLEIGGTVVYDFDQYGGLQDGDDDGVPDDIDRFPDDSRWAADTDRDNIPDELDRDADGDGRIDVDFGGKVLDPAEQKAINQIMRNAGVDTLMWDTAPTVKENPFNKTNVRDPFGMIGLDAAYRLIDKPGLRLVTYAQIAASMDDNDINVPNQPARGQASGYGISAPGVWLTLGPLDARVEYRHIRDQFLPEYFDGLYDHSRVVADLESGSVVTRDATLDSLDGQSMNGVFGQLGIGLGNFARLNAQYQLLHGDENNQRLYGSASLDEGIMQFVPKLGRLEAFYNKNNIGMYGDDFFDPTVDMMYGYNVGFEMGGGVMILWSSRWIYTPEGDYLSASKPKVKSQKQVTFETVISF